MTRADDEAWERARHEHKAIVAAKDAEIENLRAALRPFAKWARLEELHGSTVGHPDLDDATECLIAAGEIEARCCSVGDFRRARELAGDPA